MTTQKIKYDYSNKFDVEGKPETSPMQSLIGGIHIIQGKLFISAVELGDMILCAGHKIIIEESTNEICVLKGVRGDTKETETTSFTIAEAQRAGLIKAGGGWTKYPKDMCFARALSRLAKSLFKDVFCNH